MTEQLEQSRVRAIQQQIVKEQYELEQMDLKQDSRRAEYERRKENYNRNRPILANRILELKKELKTLGGE